jgi:phosphatidylglycerol---prolipoprotein diacylglyceryl transferase
MLTFPDIDPIAFRLGPVAIRWYGISYLVGIAIAWGLMLLRARKKDSGWSAQEVGDLVFYTTLGLVLGGRIGYVLFYNFPAYMENPLAIFKIWEGGMSFHGGLLGALFAAWLFGRKYGKPFFTVTDFLAPSIPPALFSGRIGNFINGELWGRPTDLPWGMVFPDPAAGGIPRHPSQLYEAFLEGIVLFVILWVFSSKPRPQKATSGLFLISYGGLRFLVEFMRMPDAHLGFVALNWMTMGQILSIPMIVIGIGLMLYAYRHERGSWRKAGSEQT